MDLKIPLILHNLTCFVASVYTFVAGVYALTTTPSLLPVSEGNSNVIHVLYAYWISKVIELLDTVFIIFRHKKRQLTARRFMFFITRVCCSLQISLTAGRVGLQYQSVSPLIPLYT